MMWTSSSIARSYSSEVRLLARCRRLRLLHEVTCAAVAEVLSMKPNAFSSWENNGKAVPVEYIALFAKAIGADRGELYVDVTSPRGHFEEACESAEMLRDLGRKSKGRPRVYRRWGLK